MSQETTPGGASPQDTRAPQPPRRTWARPNRWLAIGANLGVLLGLIVLIYEVRQNAALSRISLEVERVAAQSRYEMHMADPVMSELWMKAVYTPEALTPTELRMMDANMVAAVLTWEHLMTMRDGGLVDNERVAWHVENNAPFYFGFAFGKNWWRENAIGWQGSDLYPIADPIVRNVDESFLTRFYENLSLNEQTLASAAPTMLDDRAAIEAASRQWVETYNRNDWEALAALFMPDATMMPPNGSAVMGRDAIATWESGNEAGFRIAFELDAIEGSGDLAYVRGRSCVFIPDGTGGYGVDLGKFLEVRRRQPDGSWLIEADVFNSDLPSGAALLPECPFAEMPPSSP